MLTAKRAFNFMLGTGELNTMQLLDVARFSPTTQGNDGLLRQVSDPNRAVQQPSTEFPGTVRHDSTAPARAADESGDASANGQRTQQNANAPTSPHEGSSIFPPQYVPPAGGTDFKKLERRRQRDSESMSHLDSDSTTRNHFAVPDLDSDAVRGRDYRTLTENEKTVIREHLKETRFKDMDLDAIKIHVGRTPWYMPKDAKAITLENRIMVEDKDFDPETKPEHMRLLLEEAIHSGQFQSGMTRPGYLLDAALRGGYGQSSYENEAWSIIDSPRPVQPPSQNPGRAAGE